MSGTEFITNVVYACVISFFCTKLQADRDSTIRLLIRIENLKKMGSRRDHFAQQIVVLPKEK